MLIKYLKMIKNLIPQKRRMMDIIGFEKDEELKSLERRIKKRIKRKII